jgi:hypothetical protein
VGAEPRNDRLETAFGCCEARVGSSVTSTGVQVRPVSGFKEYFNFNFNFNFKFKFKFESDDALDYVRASRLRRELRALGVSGLPGRAAD